MIYFSKDLNIFDDDGERLSVFREVKLSSL